MLYFMVLFNCSRMKNNYFLMWGRSMNETTSTAFQGSSAPVGQLNTKRSLLKYIFLGIVTFGIYVIVFYSGISIDINVIANRYDGKKTMHYCLLAFLIGPITLGIAYFVWFHKISGRIGNALTRGIDYCWTVYLYTQIGDGKQ